MVPTLDVLFVQSLLHYFRTLTSAYFSTDDTVEDILVKSAVQCEYSKTCHKRPLKKDQKWFSKPIIA